MHPAETPAPSGNDPAELVPIAEGAIRLGLAHDTVRKRLGAGTLRGEKRNGRWFVWVPMPEAISVDAGTPSGSQSGQHPAPSGTMPDAMIARLEDEITFLRAELASRTEEIRRRDHIIAGFVERMAALPETIDVQNRPQDANAGPLRDDEGVRASVTLHQDRDELKPVSDTLALRWRRWWRGLMSG